MSDQEWKGDAKKCTRLFNIDQLQMSVRQQRRISDKWSPETTKFADIVKARRFIAHSTAVL